MDTPIFTPRKGDWKVTVTTHSGKRFNYNLDTESDADLLAIALTAHSRDIASADVLPA